MNWRNIAEYFCLLTKEEGERARTRERVYRDKNNNDYSARYREMNKKTQNKQTPHSFKPLFI